MKIVLLHGALGAADQLEPLAEAFAERRISPGQAGAVRQGKTDQGNHSFSIPAFTRLLNERQNDWKELFFRTKDMMLSLGEIPFLDKEHVSYSDRKVLILRGEADNLVNEEVSSEIAQSLPKENLRILPGLPHPLEQVTAVDIVKVIVDF